MLGTIQGSLVNPNTGFFRKITRCHKKKGLNYLYTDTHAVAISTPIIGELASRSFFQQSFGLSSKTEQQLVLKHVLDKDVETI